MKTIGAFILLCLYVFALYRPLAPLVDYASNYHYYSTILCVNKDRPELACKGQCVLMQMMEQTAEEQNPLNNIVINAEEEIPEWLPISHVSPLLLSEEIVHASFVMDPFASVSLDGWTPPPDLYSFS